MSAPEPPIEAIASLPEVTLESLERQWLQNTIEWLRCAETRSEEPATRTKRLRQLTAALETPETRDRLARIWNRASPDHLLSDAALPEETSLIREISLRLKRRLIPQSEHELDLYAILESAGLTLADAAWVATLSEDDIAPWISIIGATREHLDKALRLLAARVASVGLSRDLLAALPRLWENQRGEDQSPFDDLLKTIGRDPSDTAAAEEAVLRCRLLAGVAHARLEERGVSANLVFCLDLLLVQLERMEVLLRLADGREDGRKFTAMLIRGFAENRGIHAMFRNAINRLARRVVEHTSRTGEHCIAASLPEWRLMGLGATGAGAITAFTALFKYILQAAPFAPFWIGVVQSLNYAASFLLMQTLGWMLASKMPSMTASALAAAMGKEDGMQAEVRLIATITRTQFIVTAGNLLGAMPTALLVDAFLRWTTGHPFLSEEAALHSLHVINPFASFTILFAAITGAFLWLSSLAAGWSANWMRFHSLPQAIAHSRSLQRIVGAHFAAKLAARMDHGFSAAVGYLVLGFLLGLLPLIGAFVGIPLEVRHITLSSASVAYAVSGSYREAGPWLVSAAATGIVVTGVLNFAVSFALGLWLAVRARNLDTRGRRALLTALVREITREPSRFVWSYEPSREDDNRLSKATPA
jgi:site-specific recombinase